MCKYGSFKTIRHSRLVKQLRAILRESGAVVSPREVEVPAWRQQTGQTARLDVAFVAGGVRTYVDVTVRHPKAAKYRARACQLDGAAAGVAEAAKLARYPDLAAAGLLAAVPFAVETYGRMGPGARRLLAAARQRVAELDERMQGWAVVALSQRWQALLSCDLQRSLHEAAQASWGAPGPLQANGPDEAGSLLAAVLDFAH